MRKLLFNTIKAALLTIVDENEESVIKHIDRWNNQLQFAEQEQPFECPAVFIEFAPITWQPLQRGIREANVQITLHVVTDSRVGSWSDTIKVFEFLDTIHAALHGLHVTEEKRTIDTLRHLQSVTDSEFDELEDNRETYTCHVTDATAYPILWQSSEHITFEVGAEVQHPATS